MKKILITICILTLLGCGPGELDEEGFAKTEDDRRRQKTISDPTHNYDYNVVRLGQCQYVIGRNHGMHKGDCDNPIHCHNK